MSDKDGRILPRIAELLNTIRDKINHRCYVTMTTDHNSNLALFIRWAPTTQRQVLQYVRVFTRDDLRACNVTESTTVQRIIDEVNAAVRKSYGVKGQ